MKTKWCNDEAHVRKIELLANHYLYILKDPKLSSKEIEEVYSPDELPINFYGLSENERRQWLCEELRETIGEDSETFINFLAGTLCYGDSGSPLNVKPEWLDMDKFLKGQKFALDHAAGVSLAIATALTLTFTSEMGLDVVILTGKSSTPYTAFKRYLSTLNRVTAWYTENPWVEGTNAYKEIVNVRRAHESIRKYLHETDNRVIAEKSKLRNPVCPMRDTFLKDFASLCPAGKGDRLPKYDLFPDVDTRPKGLNQTEMQVVQFAFMGLLVLYPEAFGIHGDQKEGLEAFCHTWRGIAYLLGIDDEYNFCRGSLKEIQERSRSLIDGFVKPNLYKCDPSWEHMSRSFLDGLSYYLPLFNFQIVILYLMETMDCQMPNLRASLSYMDLLAYKFLQFSMHTLMKLPMVERVWNAMIKLAVKRASNFSKEQLARLQEKSAKSFLEFSTTS